MSSHRGTPRHQQPHAQTPGIGAPSTRRVPSSRSDRHPSNSMGPPSTTNSSQSFGISLPSSSPTPSTTSIRRPSNLFVSPPSAAGFLGSNIPSPSPSSIFAPQPYTQYSEFLAPSPSPIQSNTTSLQPPGRGGLTMQNPTQTDHQAAYAHFCRQIQETFRNMARGLLGARPGIYQTQRHPNDFDRDVGNHREVITTPIPTTQAHCRLAAQLSLAVSTLIQSLPLPPTPPYHDQYSQEDLALNEQTLWIVSFPHHFTPAGEMRSGVTDYFRNADRNLKILCRNEEWGVLARRCRREFARFIERLEEFGFEAVFHAVQGEYFGRGGVGAV
ncbi:hypothetical protein FKW77_010163 [Venturia effusa]|uniref:Uncharacterized protein n=1 Tax=Venturia effusa TaxID=50376 RepID=A0A517L293_9PEZI|nr:hypothetical protein FKW77_010163 [Venturia effusa]